MTVAELEAKGAIADKVIDVLEAAGLVRRVGRRGRKPADPSKPKRTRRRANGEADPQPSPDAKPADPFAS